ncbi:MAG TPA: hypothetical protein VJ901_14805 [Thermoanaerobaculia bacterium]|nr:hypothetical protein [Thermoanaerobaculia bacterium]
MDPEALRRFVENHRAAQEREAQEVRGNPMPFERSWAFAMELLRFDEQMNGDPFSRHDPIEDEDDRRKYEAWTKLRTGWKRER